jgi:hypothetical protein
LTEQLQKGIREIVLTKNGRSDLDFLIFQDIQGLDETYLPAPGSSNPASGTPNQPKKGYFRVKRAAALLDPASVGRLSDAHGAYQVDLKNYMDRWLCLAKLIDPPTGTDTTCYSYPTEWMTLPPDKPSPSAPRDGMEIIKLKRAPRLEMKNLAPSSLLPAAPGRRRFNRLATTGSG